MCCLAQHPSPPSFCLIPRMEVKLTRWIRVGDAEAAAVAAMTMLAHGLASNYLPMPWRNREEFHLPGAQAAHTEDNGLGRRCDR
mmetsp:Transcript_26026/g.39551  ORF Transcript_26026/g.39551 Transcript_26026/m.39551 type:complete len:84 (-) Transcript_26026:65-316(-)